MFIQVKPLWSQTGFGDPAGWIEEPPTLLNVLYINQVENYGDGFYRVVGGVPGACYSIVVKGPFEEIRAKIEEAARHTAIVEVLPRSVGPMKLG